MQGMTAHLIEVKEGKWKIKAAVIGFKALSGGHSGENLRRYSVGLLDHIGIMDRKNSKMSHLSHMIPISPTPDLQSVSCTLDNTGNNNTMCRTIQDIHTHWGLEWNSTKWQLLSIFYISSWCFTHLFPLQLFGACYQPWEHWCNGPHHKDCGCWAIWEYNPTQEDNRVSGGSLDVIAAIHTLTIRVIVVLSLCRLSYNIST